MAFGSRLLDTSIFSRDRTHGEAARARRLENIYHAGQDKIWDGRQVLGALIDRHNGVNIPLDVQRALAKVFSVLMWGELAAWKISAQLADSLEDFEAKMAATSQVHDEARHFYVLHDYLEHLDIEVPDIDPAARLLLETVLGTDSLAEKLIGMQLFVESIALTIFKAVRELNVEPVLSELLVYYERDEARHVGLGVQHAPELVRGLSLKRRLKLDAFQLRILLIALASLKRLEPSFRTLGVDPRAVVEIGKEKMVHTLEMVAEANGEDMKEIAGPVVTRIFEGTLEMMFPMGDSVRSFRRRLLTAGRALYSSPLSIQRPS